MNRQPANDNLARSGFAKQHVQHAFLKIVLVDPAAHAGMALWIQVHQQYAAVKSSQAGGQVNG